MAAAQFLGSEIALISKSDVRYTGILREVDIPNSRVCLQFCRSHGTEGRRGNMAEELAPSPQIYDYVVFRASDIKDLYVLRTPTAAMQQDPAIVNAYMNKGERPPQSSQQTQQLQQQQAPMPGPGMPYNMQPQQGPSHMQQQQQHPAHSSGYPVLPTEPSPPQQQEQQQVSRGYAQAAAPSTPSKASVVEPPSSKDKPTDSSSSKSTPISFQGVDSTLQAPRYKDKAGASAPIVHSFEDATISKPQEQVERKQDVRTRDHEPRSRRGGKQGYNGGGDGNRGGEHHFQHQQHHQQQQQDRGERGARRGGPSNRRGRGRGRGGGTFDRYSKDEVVPATDFDFDSANAKFNKNEFVKEFSQVSLHEEVRPVAVPVQPQQPTGEFYSRTKSFFDDISCDAKERLEQQQEGKLSLNERRARLQHERKTNLETFGKVSADGATGYRGGRGRGRGGRGGSSRGGANGNNSHPNNNRSNSPSRGGIGYNGNGGGRGGQNANRRGGRPPR